MLLASVTQRHSGGGGGADHFASGRSLSAKNLHDGGQIWATWEIVRASQIRPTLVTRIFQVLLAQPNRNAANSYFIETIG